jgi:phosphoglycerate dehydrogenase-like enzyme
MKVVISFDLSEKYTENLRKGFPNVEFGITADPARLIHEIRDADAVFTSPGQFNSELLRSAHRTKIITGIVEFEVTEVDVVENH